VLLFHHEQRHLWAAADLQLETGKRIEQFQCHQRMNDSFNGRKSVQQLSMVARAARCRVTSAGFSVTSEQDGGLVISWNRVHEANFVKYSIKNEFIYFFSRTTSNSGRVKHSTAGNVKLEVGTAR
jgi:hypothetical protein